MTEFVTLYVTAEDEEEAAALAGPLVSERLVACANVIPRIRSIYRWKGEVEDDGEAAMLLKTRADLAEAAIARINELHPYETPCVTVWPIEGGNADYLQWVRDQTATNADPDK